MLRLVSRVRNLEGRLGYVLDRIVDPLVRLEVDRATAMAEAVKSRWLLLCGSQPSENKLELTKRRRLARLRNGAVNNLRYWYEAVILLTRPCENLVSPKHRSLI